LCNIHQQGEYVNLFDAVLFLFHFQDYPGKNSSPEFQTSVAYVFRPLMPDAQPVNISRIM
jgi:hypothetical protein